MVQFSGVGSEPAHNWLILAYWAKGMYRESVEEEQAALRRGGRGELATQLGRVYAARGYKGVQEWELETNLRAWRKHWVRAVDVAMAYSELGHNDEAFEWLQRARKAHEAPVVLVRVMRSYDNLRTDPRYLEFLRSLQLAD